MTRLEKRNEILRLAKDADNFNIRKTLDEQMSGARDIIVYGAGNVGREVVNIIMKMGGGGGGGY